MAILCGKFENHIIIVVISMKIQNSALTPDAYSTIPELNGGGGGTMVNMHTGSRNPSATSSQCSFGGTGTFVYKKY
jgi:hypothetical protein